MALRSELGATMHHLGNLILHDKKKAFSHATESLRERINGKSEFEKIKLALARTGKFKTFLRLLAISGFEPTLMRYVQSQPITLFIPTDAAFALLPLRVKSQLFGKKLRQLLEFHMVQEKFPSDFFKIMKVGATFPTVYGPKIEKRKDAQGKLHIAAVGATDSAAVVLPNIEPKELILCAVHGVNRVLLPPKVFRTGLLKV